MKLIFTLTLVLFLLVPLRGEEPLPSDVQRILDQRAAAIAKIDRTCVEELKKLKSNYTKQGNLEAAVKINELLKTVESGGELGFPPIYLDDLQEADATSILGILGKHGKNHAGENFTFRGAIPKNSIFTHPLPNAKSSVTYHLNGRYVTFKGMVAIGSQHYRTASPLTFRVLEGAEVLWQSKPLTEPHDSQEYSIGVRGRLKITLEVVCPGGNNMAWAVWLDPRLTR